MEPLIWSPSLSLGIAEMDNAHQVLIEQLIAIMQAPDHEFTSRLQDIIRMLEEDFREEEVLMEKMAYKGLQVHRKEHADLLSTLHHVVPKAMQGEYVLPRQVLNMLPQWFLQHLVKMDAALVRALNAFHGSSTTPENNPV